jgi:cellobiose phosphorylase
MYRISFVYILGVRATYDGLLINPAIPSIWKSFKVERIFRGTRYLIEVQNPRGVDHGVSSIMVDEKKIEGNIIPETDKDTCIVKVTM